MPTNAQIVPDNQTLVATALVANAFTLNPKVPVTGANFNLTAYTSGHTLTIYPTNGNTPLGTYTAPTVTITGAGASGCTLNLSTANLKSFMGTIPGGATQFDGKLSLTDGSSNTAIVWQGSLRIKTNAAELEAYVANTTVTPDSQTLTCSALADNYFKLTPTVGAATPADFDLTTYTDSPVLKLTATNGLTPWATVTVPTIALSNQGVTGVNLLITAAHLITAFSNIPGGATEFTGTLTMVAGGLSVVAWAGAFKLNTSDSEMAAY